MEDRRIASSRTTPTSSGGQMHSHFNSSGELVGNKYTPGNGSVVPPNDFVMLFMIIWWLINPRLPFLYIGLVIGAVVWYVQSNPNCHKSECSIEKQIQTLYRVRSPYTPSGKLIDPAASDLHKSLPNLSACGGTGIWFQRREGSACYTNMSGPKFAYTGYTISLYKDNRSYALYAGKDCKPTPTSSGVAFLEGGRCVGDQMRGNFTFATDGDHTYAKSFP